MFSYFTINNLWTLVQQLLDIACVWAVVYYCLRIVKNNSRTIQIFKGVLLIVIIRFAASIIGLHTVADLADSIMNWGVIAIVIIFQPEIRNILEKIGKSSVFSRISTLTVNERENLVDELLKACGEMSKTKTGALISIEQGHSLTDFIKTGTPMNSVVSSELLCSIFQYGTPLHDGAVIIQGVKIACAAAYFPPTTRELPTSYGARHRAAVGISEITDSLTIVVSEETGNISIAEGGKLTVISQGSLREFLMDAVCNRSDAIKEDENEKDSHQENSTQGKRPSVFAHYFKSKNRKVKEHNEADYKYAKKRKEEEDSVDILQSETVVLDKMEIEDLTQKQDAKLDQLFENIVSEPEKKEKEAVKETKKTKKKTTASRKKAVQEQKNETKRGKQKVATEKAETTASPFTTMGTDLLDDVVEPEAIVLHYESEDEETGKEGGDS